MLRAPNVTVSFRGPRGMGMKPTLWVAFIPTRQSQENPGFPGLGRTQHAFFTPDSGSFISLWGRPKLRQLEVQPAANFFFASVKLSVGAKIVPSDCAPMVGSTNEWTCVWRDGTSGDTGMS